MNPWDKDHLKDRLLSSMVLDPGTGCWLWDKATYPFGYGAIRIGNFTASAHRIAYECWVGQIPDGLVACHKCDVPRCFRPDHLFLGTKADNSADMVKKRRNGRGQNNGYAKLTNEQARAIFLAEGPQTRIAKEFGCSQMTVSWIKQRKKWQSVTEDLVPVFRVAA